MERCFVLGWDICIIYHHIHHHFSGSNHEWKQLFDDEGKSIRFPNSCYSLQNSKWELHCNFNVTLLLAIFHHFIKITLANKEGNTDTRIGLCMITISILLSGYPRIIIQLQQRQDYQHTRLEKAVVGQWPSAQRLACLCALYYSISCNISGRLFNMTKQRYSWYKLI
jgi:hypothetical protein